MDKGIKESGNGSSQDGAISEIEEVIPEPQTIIEHVEAIVRNNIWGIIDDKDKLCLFLQSWWSRTYNRPLKDPLLLSYSLEELLYEYYDKIERIKYEKYLSEKVENDEEKEKIDSALKWAEEEEQKEMEEWMNKKLKEEKEKHGEDFGEDISLYDFENIEV